MKILTPIKGFALATSLTFAMFANAQHQNFKMQNQISTDTFEVQKFEDIVSPQGIKDFAILEKAPVPYINIAGVEKTASIVVDISKNILYKYDSNGNAVNAFLVASGKTSTPTDVGTRIVTHVEKYPYRSAPKQTQRYKKPWNYGPRIICLNKIDEISGKQSPTGEFIHGNNNPDSLGKHASKGCIRMDNEIIKIIAEQAKPGDIVIIQK